MVGRVFASSGGGLKVSKPGVEVTTAADVDLLLGALTRPVIFLATGTATFTGAGTLTRTLPVTSDGSPPVVILKATDNTMPDMLNFYAVADSPFTTLSIRNERAIARTITYVAFQSVADTIET